MDLSPWLLLYGLGAILGLLLTYWVIRQAVTDALRTVRREEQRNAGPIA